jgi:ankyrin repeat protein
MADYGSASPDLATIFRVTAGALLCPIAYIPYDIVKGFLYPLLSEASLLHVSAFFGSKSITEFLCAVGYDTNKPDTDGYTPLDNAILKNRLHVAEILIRHGARIEDQPADEPSPEMWALLRSKRALTPTQ